MRRFSQRNSLVTLNEINITPLLDLAFVLLVIFIITRPLLEQTIDVKLPPGGKAPIKADPRDLRTVEISSHGIFKFGGKRLTSDQIIRELSTIHHSNPNLVVVIRADGEGAAKYQDAIIDGIVKQGITRFSIKTAPDSSR